MERSERRQTELVFLLVLAACSMGSAYVIGQFTLGRVFGFSVLFAALPMLVCWIAFLLIHIKRKLPLWITALLVLATLAIYPILRQPWSPGAVFLNKMEKIKVGMSDKDVQRIMAGYLGGKSSETSDKYLSEELREKGATHIRSYRWTNKGAQHNADVVHVFLRDGTVIGTDFSPD